MKKDIASTKYGDIHGVIKNDTVLFKGIKFGHSPRFLPPTEVESFKGLYEANKFGQVSYQTAGSLGGLLGGPEPDVAEECLFLNVHTPAVDQNKRPVMVWIHGGGFTGGSGSTPWYNGQSFVEKGNLVLVTINYRLGALGFLNVADYFGQEYQSSGLTGILDQIFALKWVDENIESFGGDPNNVTIFGESAGAMSVGTLLAIEEARKYFNKAILQSGAGQNCLSLGESKIITDTFIDLLKLDSPNDLLSVNPSLLLGKQELLSAELLKKQLSLSNSSRLMIGLPFQPVIDEYYLKQPTIESIGSGDAKDIPIVVGTNLDEWNLFSLMFKSPDDTAKIKKRLSLMSNRADEIVQSYESEYPDLLPAQLWNKIMTDVIFTAPAVRLLRTQLRFQKDCYRYLFSWKSTSLNGALGSCHALEIPFVFNNLGATGVSLITGDNAPQELADEMHSRWISFAKNGSPNLDKDGLDWPKYSNDNYAFINFNEETAIDKESSFIQTVLQ
jgi:para-nitrobenzyl esterase